MENQVKKIDSNSIMNNVKERIRSAYIALIPDPAWEALVKTEIDDFFQIKNRQGYHNISHSQFGSVVQTILKERIKKLLTSYVNNNFASNNWDNGLPEPKQFIKDIILQNNEKITADFLASMLQKSITTDF